MENTIQHFRNIELSLLSLLDRNAMHVRALRTELHDNGAVSKYLKHLEELDLIRREKRKTRVVNTLTPKGRRVIRTLKALKI